jgi:hypothetical protein
MINLIFWSLVFILISSIINKPTANNLYCGLFGYCSDSPPDIDKLKILGILNEERGKHSAGMYVGDEIIKDTGTFTNLIRRNDIYKEVYDMSTGDAYDNVDYTVIGHTRQPSAGMGSTKHQAHPFGIVNPEDQYGDYKLVGAHNGTITNWKELCKDFDVDIKAEKIEVDSLGLLTILADKKFDVLNKYEGGAAILWTYPSTKNTLFVFKGATKGFATSVNFIEDRPLFYWRTKKDGKDAIYISSLKESLYCIGGENNNVLPFDSNYIYAINAGVITKLKFDVSRTNVHNGTKYNNNSYGQSSFGYDDDYYTSSYYRQQQLPSTQKIIPIGSSPATAASIVKTNPLYSQIPFYNYPKHNYNKGINKVFSITIDDVITETSYNNEYGKIYYGESCKMYRNGHLLGSISSRNRIKLAALKKAGNYVGYCELLTETIAVKYKLDRLGFAQNSLYTLYKKDDDFTEYMFIDGYMIDPKEKDTIIDFADYYYYGKDDVSILASLIIQPIIVDSPHTINSRYNKELIAYFNINEVRSAPGINSAFSVDIPFTNGRLYTIMYESSVKDLNSASIFSLHIDYSYSSILFEKENNNTRVYEVAYFEKENNIEVLDSFLLCNGNVVKSEDKTEDEVTDLPFTIDDEFEARNSYEKLAKEVDDLVNNKEQEDLVEFSFDLEILQSHYDLCNDISDTIVDFLRTLENEEGLNTVEATKCLNLFTSECKDIVDQYETSRHKYIDKITKLDEDYQEKAMKHLKKVYN